MTQPNCVLGISIPSVSHLDVHPDSKEQESNNFSIPIETSDRITFGLTFAPSTWKEPGTPAIKCDYGDVAIYIHPMIFENFETPSAEHFVYIAPESLFQNQQLGKNQAELAFVQGTGNHEIVVRGPNSKGVYTMYFAVVMRIPPKVDIKLRNPDFRFELLKNDTPHKLKFRIFGKGDLVREKDLRQIIKSIVLDAEIH